MSANVSLCEPLPILLLAYLLDLAEFKNFTQLSKKVGRRLQTLKDRSSQTTSDEEQSSSVNYSHFPCFDSKFVDRCTAKKNSCTSRLQCFSSLPCVPYLLVVKGIVNGVTQSGDKIWLRYQQHALLDQKLCLDKQQTEVTVKKQRQVKKTEDSHKFTV